MRGENSRALSMMDQIAEAIPKANDNPGFQCDRFMFARSSGDNALAASLAKEVIVKFPQSPLAEACLMFLAEQSVEQSDLKQAKDYLLKLRDMPGLKEDRKQTAQQNLDNVIEMSDPTFKRALPSDIQQVSHQNNSYTLPFLLVLFTLIIAFILCIGWFLRRGVRTR